MSVRVLQRSWTDWIDSGLNFLGQALGAGFGTSIGTSMGLDYCPRDSVQDPNTIYPTAGERILWWRGDTNVVLNGSRVATITDPWNAQVLSTFGVAAIQPLYETAGLLSKHSWYNDDAARRMANVTINVPSGTRAYCFVVAQWQNTGSFNDLFLYGDNDMLTVRLGIQAAASWTGQRDEGVPSDSVTNGARDTTPHVFEIGYTAGGIDAFVVDGVGANSSVSGTPSVNAVQVRTTGNPSGNGPRARLAEVIIVVDPSAAQKALTRAYFDARYVGI